MSNALLTKKDLSRHGIQERDEKELQVIFEVVCNFFGVDSAEVLNGGKYAEFSTPRHIATYIMRYKRFSITKISTFLKRDHSTIIHSVRLIDGFVLIYPTYEENIAKILSLLN
jgi:chromosomal replication initiation ATPase DnaA